jgi:hypothetical protein
VAGEEVEPVLICVAIPKSDEGGEIKDWPAWLRMVFGHWPCSMSDGDQGRQKKYRHNHIELSLSYAVGRLRPGLERRPFGRLTRGYYTDKVAGQGQILEHLRLGAIPIFILRNFHSSEIAAGGGPAPERREGQDL